MIYKRMSILQSPELILKVINFDLYSSDVIAWYRLEDNYPDKLTIYWALRYTPDITLQEDEGDPFMITHWIQLYSYRSWMLSNLSYSSSIIYVASSLKWEWDTLSKPW